MFRWVIAPAGCSLGLAIGLMFVSVGRADEAESTCAQAKPVVTLTIDFGDGFQKRYPALPWRDKTTVLDVLNQAAAHARGIKFKHRGKGATAFLTQIDDLKNQGRGKNWIFRVNGKLGDRSFALTPVKAGDKVQWKFDVYR